MNYNLFNHIPKAFGYFQYSIYDHKSYFCLCIPIYYQGYSTDYYHIIC